VEPIGVRLRPRQGTIATVSVVPPHAGGVHLDHSGGRDLCRLAHRRGDDVWAHGTHKPIWVGGVTFAALSTFAGGGFGDEAAVFGSRLRLGVVLAGGGRAAVNGGQFLLLVVLVMRKADILLEVAMMAVMSMMRGGGRWGEAAILRVLIGGGEVVAVYGQR
jgi:hypothetical protein